MDKHVNSICRSANYHIRALRHVRSATSAEVAKNIACAIVDARLDYRNSLFVLENQVKNQRFISAENGVNGSCHLFLVHFVTDRCTNVRLHCTMT